MKAVRPPTPSPWMNHRRIEISRTTGREKEYEPVPLGPLGKLLMDAYMDPLTTQLFTESTVMRYLRRSTC